MSRQILLIISRSAVWTDRRLRPISASAKPCWHGLGHLRFAWVAGGSTTGLTSTGGWITISHEGGP
jgi:hypothetical protein